MATIRLVPSTYSISNTNYMSASDTDNMMTNTSSDTYGTVTHNRATTNSTYYFYLRGFNFGSLPDGAEVSSFSVKIRAKATGNTTSTSSSYRMSLYNNTTSIGSTTVSSSLSTTVNTFTFPNGSLTWYTLSSYGANFGIRIPLRRANSNTASVATIYGAEIEVTYTLPVFYNVTASSNVSDITISPTSASVREGEDQTFTIEGNSIDDIVFTDNGTDVTSSLVEHPIVGPTQTATSIPVSFDSTNSVYDRTGGDSGNGIYGSNYIENGLTDHTSTTRCALYSVQGANQVSMMYYNFNVSSIPANAEILSVSCQFKGGSQGTSYYSSVVAQLCTGTTAKGTSSSISGTNSSPSTVTISGGSSWTRAELDSIKIRFQVTRGSSNTTTQSTWSFFGATLTVTYTVPTTGSYWTYELTNIQEEHTLVIDESGTGEETLLFKQSGTWIEAPTVYKKINGAWVQQTKVTNLFKNIRFRHGSQT